MKKHNWKDLALGMVIMALVMGLAVPAFAASVKTLQANSMDIKLVIDGEAVTPKDVNGKVVEPFAVDGTTYLPVRAVGEALGKEVTWDGKTNTVYIGEVPAGVTMPEVSGDVEWSEEQKQMQQAIWKTGAVGNLAKMPHTSKVMEELGAEKNPNGKGQKFYLKTKDNTDGSYFGVKYVGNAVCFDIGAGYNGMGGDYLTAIKAILLDVVPDAEDAKAIYEIFVEIDNIYKTLRECNDEGPKADAAYARLTDFVNGVELNSVTYKQEDGLRKIRLK